jgi:hypothetical protein
MSARAFLEGTLFSSSASRHPYFSLSFWTLSKAASFALLPINGCLRVPFGLTSIPAYLLAFRLCSGL